MIAKPKIILMSHGFMAEQTLESAKMIVGDTKDVATVAMLAEDGLSGTNEKLSKVLDSVNQVDPVLVIADLKGGTPCNVAMTKMEKYKNLRVLTGLNLAITIEAIMSPTEDIDALIDYLVTIGKDAVFKIELDIVDDENEYEE